MRKSLCLILCVCLLAACLPLSARAAVVMLSAQSLTVDGRPIQCEKYNIDGSNYFKLRDVACLLNGTDCQFEVGYDAASRTVTVTSGQPYTPNGEELVIGLDRSASAAPSTQAIRINGALNESLRVYNLGGNNFFRLRDLGSALGFTVDYDQSTNTAIILSRAPAETPAPTDAPAPDGDGSALSSRQIFDRCAPAVFLLETCDVTGEACTRGSGFFIDSSGIAVTNHHVLRNALSATVTLTDGTVCAVTGVIDFDAAKDYAILQVEGSGFPTLPIGDSAALSGGDVCYAIGSPQGLRNTISDGIISNPSRTDLGEELIQITAPISQGSSGGALIDDRGRVIGVTTSSLVSGQNLNFAVPINAVAEAAGLAAYRIGAATAQPLPDYATLQAFLEYESRPQAYERVLEETDGYNELACGDTVSGVLNGPETDTYFVYCNTTGQLQAYLVANGTQASTDFTVTARRYRGTQDEARSDFYRTGEGAEAQVLLCAVAQPGCYTLSVSSNAPSASGGMPYALYYLFVPGDAELENTTGDVHNAQELAFRALYGWIEENSTETRGSGSKSFTFADQYEDGSGMVFSLISAPASDGIPDTVMVSFTYVYPGGAMDDATLFLQADGQTFYALYYYYPDAASSEPVFRGGVEVSAPDFSAGTPLAFTATEGAPPDGLTVADFGAGFAESLSLGLKFLDMVLKDGVGGAGIADFGFNPAAALPADA